VRVSAWLLAPALFLISVGLVVRYRSQVPSRTDWADAVSDIRSEFASGDGVTWSPYYMGEGRLFFDDLNAFHLADDGPVDFARYQRVWLLTTPQAEVGRLLDGHTTLKQIQHGQVTLRLLKVGGKQVTGDLYADLGSVQVTKGPVDRAKDCSFWSGRGWYCDLKMSRKNTENCLSESTAKRLARHRRRRDPRCGLNRWMNVSRDIRVIGRTPRRCVWFHPDQRRSTRINWSLTGSGNELSIKYGFTDMVIANHARPKTRTQPLTLTVLADGREIATKRIEPTQGWFSWSLPVENPKDVSFVLDTKSHVDAHFCFDPVLLDEGRETR